MLSGFCRSLSWALLVFELAGAFRIPVIQYHTCFGPSRLSRSQISALRGGTSASGPAPDRESRALQPMVEESGDRKRSESWGEARIVKSMLGDPVPPAPGSGENVLVIGVAGGSGGGKSVFCKKLEGMIREVCHTIVLSHDSYYKDKVDVDRDCGGNWDCPEALHTHELVRDLLALKAGKRVCVPEYDFAANARSSNAGTERWFEPGTKGVLVVEGLMVLHNAELRDKMDVRIYVDCDEDTRFMRRLARDTHPLKGRGRTVAQVYNAWAKNVKPNHHRFVEPTKRFANLIVPHHGVFADPGHLLAVDDNGVQAYAAPASGQEPQGESSIEEVEAEREDQMFPVLYMLEAYVRAFTAKAPAAEPSQVSS